MRAQDLLPISESALKALIHLLKPETEELPNSYQDLAKEYTRIKSELGRKGSSEALGVNESELSLLEATIRDVGRSIGKFEEDDPSVQRNAAISQLRFLSWAETIGGRAHTTLIPDDVKALISEDLGRKQARALELVLRSLINESYGKQDELIGRLKSLFKDQVVEKWRQQADAEDILSGTAFSELASLFINKEEFNRYSGYFEETPFLTLLRDRRKTIQTFLDDVRRFRNILAHNKKVSNVQLTLMDLYYEELINPIQDAYDQGETKINPSEFLDVSKEDLDGYFDNLHEDVLSIKDDIADLRAEMEKSFAELAEETEAVKETASLINKKLIFVAAGVVVIAMAVAIIFFQGERAKNRDVQIKKTADKIDSRTTDIKEATARIEDQTERIARSLEDIGINFESLSKQGGIVTNPGTAEEFYHNARIYELNGDSGNARRAYLEYLKFDLDLIDPHLRYQTFLKVQEGREGAREIYESLRGQSKSFITEFAADLLYDREARVAKLEQFIEKYPEFAPAYYELSRDFSLVRRGTQSMEDKQKELEYLEKFEKLDQAGQFVKYYLDKKVASAARDDVQTRLKALQILAKEAIENPVKLSWMKSNQGWNGYISILDVPREIFVKTENDQDFKSTGFFDHLDQRTGRKMPKMSLELFFSKEPQKVWVKYIDIHGKERGPFEFSLDPALADINNTKQMLSHTRTSWISFRDYDGKLLVYFTTLMSYRGGIKQILYGIDEETPSRDYKFPAWEGTGTAKITSDVPTYLTVPRDTKFVSIQVLFKDGEKTEVVKFEKSKSGS